MRLSKYPVLKGIQCSKSIFLHFKKPHLATPLTPEQRMLFEAGNDVGLIGRALFNGGFDVSKGGAIRGKDLSNSTLEALQSDEYIFYEPQFESKDGQFVFKADIMV